MDKKIGIYYALVAFLAWGFLPLYWKVLEPVPALEILAHRVLWSCILVGGLLAATGRWKSLVSFIMHGPHRLAVFLGALLISVNWFTYIWAVTQHQVVEASLGYYINPLLTVALGMAALGERLNFWQLVSLLLAAAGVAIMALQYAQIPWLALILALTFAFYGLVKKVAKLESTMALALETLYLTPLAFAYLVYLHSHGSGSLGSLSPMVTLFLIGSGAATALPLLWFSLGAQRVSLSTIGFLQYLAPTISLLLGIFLFREPFTSVHVMSFGLIWCALALYSLSGAKGLGRWQPRWFAEKQELTEKDGVSSKL